MANGFNLRFQPSLLVLVLVLGLLLPSQGSIMATARKQGSSGLVGPDLLGYAGPNHYVLVRPHSGSIKVTITGDPAPPPLPTEPCEKMCLDGTTKQLDWELNGSKGIGGAYGTKRPGELIYDFIVDHTTPTGHYEWTCVFNGYYTCPATGATLYVPGPPETLRIDLLEGPDCDVPTWFSSLAEASGPSHRKIALNGLPMPDSKPHTKEESDQEREETFIDALTQQLRHSTTDIYIPLVGNELSLSVRRDTVSETWGTHPGQPPDMYLNRPFGLGWTTNLCPHIQFVYRQRNGAPPVCYNDRPEPDLALVTDEGGAQHRFLRIWDQTIPNNPKEAFLPYPSNRNEAESFLTELVVNGNGTYTFTRKFGTKLTYSPIVPQLTQNFASNRAVPADLITYEYARLTHASDRLGNTLDYVYNDVNLVPNTITANGTVANGARSIVIEKSDTGLYPRIIGVTDPRQSKTTFSYTTNTYNDPRRGMNISYPVLSTVTAPDSLAITRYEYEQFGPELDETPHESPPPPAEYFFHCNINKFTDPLGHITSIGYSTDQSRHSFSTVINGFYASPGQPRVVSTVTLPLLTTPNAQYTTGFINQSDVRIMYSADDPPVPSMYGQRSLKVVDAGGNDRYYNFFNAQIIEQNEFEDLLYNGADQRSTPFLVLYRGLQIVQPDGQHEVFTFDPAAGMALSTVEDLCGHVTRYEHNQGWSIRHGSLTWLPNWLPSSFYAQTYSDPTAQVDALGHRREFIYNVQRIMTDQVDEEGRHIHYEVQAGTGLRLSESIKDANGVEVQKTQFDYENVAFPAFLTRTTVFRHDGDPIWALNMVTECVPDLYGYVQTKRVWQGSKWLVTGYVYDENGNKTAETDPNLHTTSFVYDKLNRLTSVTFPVPDGLVGPLTKVYEYDARSNKKREKDERGNYSLWEYDEWNRVTRTARDLDGNGQFSNGDLITGYAYNPLNSRTAVVDPRGHTTQTDYDPLQRPFLVTDALGQLTWFTYGANSGASAFDVSGFKPTSVFDPRGYHTDFEYDDLYRLTKKSVEYQQSPRLNAVTETEYDDVGNAIRVWDPLNPTGNAQSRPIKTDYDALNRAVKTTFQDGEFVRILYTTTGLKHQTVDERGFSTDFAYDLAGRLVQTVAPPTFNADTGLATDGAVTSSTYDDAGNVVQTTNPRGFIWDMAYDQRNRKRHEYSPAVADSENGGAATRPHTSWDYDSVGNVTKVTDARGQATDTRYDRANRAYEVEGPAVPVLGGGTARPLLQTAYDWNGNVLTVTDANGHTTTNTYDDLNRLATTQNPAGDQIVYGYDEIGNRTSVQDGKVQLTLFAYDGLNRLTQQQDNQGRSTSFYYDGVNKTGRVDELSRKTSYAYDARHRLQDVAYFASDDTPVNNATNASRHYAYDAAGNLLAVTEAAKSGAADVAYTYDALNRILTETSGGATHQYQYDLAGNRRKVTFGETSRIISSQYDGGNRLTQESEGLAGNPARVTAYNYDLNGNVTGLASPNGDVETRAYDAVNRLSTSEHRNTGGMLLEKYEQTWDRALNLRKVIESYGDATLNRTRELAYDLADRLTEEKTTASSGLVEATSYGYDAASNRTFKGGLSYASNSLNQLTQVTQGGTVKATLEYDFAGNRIARTDATGNCIYLYDYENRLVQVTPPAGGSYKYTYDYRSRRVERVEGGTATKVVFSGGLSCFEKQAGTVQAEFIRSRDQGGGVGGLRYSLRSGNLLFSHENGRGDVVAQTDGAGALTYQAVYEAFGRHGTETGSSPDRARANTKEEDPTGLLNEGMRYRDLELGTFITRDPAGFVDGPNLYAYVRQNPWSKFDPAGLASADPEGVVRKDHHVVPVETLKEQKFSNGVVKALEKHKVPAGKWRDMPRHVFNKAHEIYNERAAEITEQYVNEAKSRDINPAGLSRKAAKTFSEELVNKINADPYCGRFNQLVKEGATGEQLNAMLSASGYARQTLSGARAEVAEIAPAARQVSKAGRMVAAVNVLSMFNDLVLSWLWHKRGEVNGRSGYKQYMYEHRDTPYFEDWDGAITRNPYTRPQDALF